MMGSITSNVKQVSENPPQPQTYDECMAKVRNSQGTAIGLGAASAAGNVTGGGLAAVVGPVAMAGAPTVAADIARRAGTVLGAARLASEGSRVAGEDAREQRTECESLR
jgi:hypothetical protein